MGAIELIVYFIFVRKIDLFRCTSHGWFMAKMPPRGSEKKYTTARRDVGPPQPGRFFFFLLFFFFFT